MSRPKNLSGLLFGRLQVTMRDGSKDGHAMWLCLCSCGCTTRVSSYYLTTGQVSSCGCLKRDNHIKARKNIKGKRFGRLIAIRDTQTTDSARHVLWECLCDCGNIKIISQSSLTKNMSFSCGCLLKEKSAERMRANKGKIKQINGRRFGRLVAVKHSHTNKKGAYWTCVCDCGGLCTISQGNLQSGHTQSCGCLLCKGSVYLYFMLSDNTGLVKIGISGNTIKRRNSLKEELKDKLEILTYCLSSRSEESAIHKQLKQYRAIHPNQPKGKEWFIFEEDVVALFNTVKEKGSINGFI